MGENIKVVDASFILSSLLPDEKSIETEEVIKQHISGQIHLIAPQILIFEIANSLHMASMRKRIESDVAKKLLIEFLDLEVTIEDLDFTKAFQLAEKYTITVYDASYVYLAKQKHIPLLTLDEQLKKIAKE